MFRNFYSANSPKEPSDGHCSTAQYPPTGPIFRRKALEIGINPEAALYLQYAGKHSIFSPAL